MLTAAEIIDKSFGKSIGGYKPDEVEAFLASVAADYEQVLSENNALQEKLEVLAETIENYRKDDVNLKAALIGAQRLGESVLLEAKNQADALKRQALSDVKRELDRIQKETQQERQALSNIQKDTVNFKNKLLSMYKSQLDMIQSIPNMADYADAHKSYSGRQEYTPPPKAERQPMKEPAPYQPRRQAETDLSAKAPRPAMREPAPYRPRQQTQEVQPKYEQPPQPEQPTEIKPKEIEYEENNQQSQSYSPLQSEKIQQEYQENFQSENEDFFELTQQDDDSFDGEEEILTPEGHEFNNQ
ncbi:MAG: DivIVA domain-containing protein [Oscillospiraceae bacterium]